MNQGAHVLALAVLPLVLAQAGPGFAQGRAPDSEAFGRKATSFSDRSEGAGVLFRHEGGVSMGMGSGLAWLDADQDGDEDLLLLSAGGNRLYRKDGPRFTDVSAGSGLALSSSDPLGVICGDYDQDGRTDVYLCNLMRNDLFRNLGGGVFQELAQDEGVATDRWSTSASWADFDLDGDLDLYVGNYVQVLSFPYHYGSPNQLFENRGAAATPRFVDRAQALGVSNEGAFGPSVPGFPYDSPEGQATAGCTLATSTLDWDEDGDPEIFVGNDFGLWVLPNAHYRNDTTGGAMRFTDVTAETGWDTRPHYNMGIYACDFDHDGDWDFYLSNLGDNLLLRNDGGVFVDATYEAGPVSGSSRSGDELLSSWGVVWEDLDNDTWEDLVVLNGYMPAAEFLGNEYRSPNHLWMNREGVFSKVEERRSGMADEGAGRCVARTDVNGDGLIDFYVQNNGQAALAEPADRSRLFVNNGVGAAGNHWVELRLRGRFSNLEALGARVEARAGGTVLERQVLGDPVYLSSPSRMVHFGLGTEEIVEVLTIHWPSGIEQELHGLPVDRLHAILEPAVTVRALRSFAVLSDHVLCRIEVKNHDLEGQDTLVRVRLRLEDGTELVGEAAEVIAPERKRTVKVVVDGPPSVLGGLSGTEVEVRVDAFATGGQDGGRLILQIP